MKTALGGDQAREILRHYNLKLRGHWPLLRGTINSNYAIDTDAGPLFLRISEGKTQEDIAFESQLIWHLGSHGVPTPALWRTRTGAPAVPLPGELPAPGGHRQPVMLMSWSEGSDRLDSEIDEKDARCVGEQLAAMHLATASLGLKRPGIYTLRHIAQRIARVQADARAQAELGATIDMLAQEATHLVKARRADLPTGIGHSDLFPDNFLFTRRHDNGVILDLEQAATVPYAYDLAVALLAFCAPVPTTTVEAPPAATADADRLGPLLRKTARALFDGYQALRALGESERQGLYEELRYAALRFTVTRITDVHGYGQAFVKALPEIPPALKADAKPDVEPAAKPPRWLRHSGPSHSKDYRDFLWRLRSLAAFDPAALVSGLL